MPWTVNSPPSVAKNWTKEEKRRCVAAANAALRDGKSDEDAIYACIGAAGKSKHKQVDEESYDEAVDDALDVFQGLVEAYLLGRITLAVLKARFSDAIRLHYTRLMILAIGDRDPTSAELELLNKKISTQEALLAGFMSELAKGEISENRALWRAGMYAPARDAYIAFTVPTAVALLLPGLPGEICLGDGLCGCHLDIQVDDEGNAAVYWIVDPQKESCEVCLDMQSQSPFLFSYEDVAGVS